VDDQEKYQKLGKKGRAKYMQSISALYGASIVAEPPKITPNLPKVKRSPRNYTEQSSQIALFTWIKLRGLFAFSIPNHGRRSRFNGKKEKDSGLYSGVSDILLAMPNKQYHGFFIELKSPGRIPTILQYEFMQRAKRHGYMADWFDDWEKAKIAIEEYLKGV